MKKNCAILLIFLTNAAFGEVRLPSIFSDHAVVQSGQVVPVWGWAKPKEKISVFVADQQHQTVADASGQWRVQLKPLVSGKSYEMRVVGENELVVKDVLAGEVWLCSGQSNMEWPVKQSANASAEMAQGKWPSIRFFDVKNKASRAPQEDVEGSWVVCSPETVGNYSAVSYYFGREIFQHLKTPVGLVVSAWGGTPAESWTPLSALKGTKELQPIVQRYEADLKQEKKLRADYEFANQTWKRHQAEWVDGGSYEDPGNRAVFKGWAEPECSDGNWKKCLMPQTFNQLGLKIDGAVWFRRWVEIPAEWAGLDLSLNLGPIDDLDTTYFNGIKVGATGKETPRFWEHSRAYKIPGSQVKPGRALVAVRIFDKSGDGGFGGTPHSFCLSTRFPSLAPSAPSKIALTGEWCYAIEHQFEEPFWKQYRDQLLWLRGGDHEHAPGNLYNAMIHPITAYPVAGTIWFQGENNADRAKQYATVLKTLVTSWRQVRALLGQKAEMPFLVVQVSNNFGRLEHPGESVWAELRESQSRVLDLKNTALVTAVDLGEADEVHFKNKQEVGRRLARAALARVYGQTCVDAGPVMKKVIFSENEARVQFDSVGSGLVIRGSTLRGFALAGADRQFYWAEGRLEGDAVILTSPEVKRPVAVRHAWANNPELNLYNQEGFPAFPFRTDTWQGLTDGAF